MEKEIQKEAAKQYSKAIKFLQEGNLAESKASLTKFIEKYTNVTDDSIQPILVKARVNISIIEAKEAPKKPPLKTPDDKLSQGVYYLNNGNYQEAVNLFNDIISKIQEKAYTHYLLSIAYLKMEEIDKSLEHLKKAIKQDEFYRILAYNEPDFEPLADNETYINLVHILDSE